MAQSAILTVFAVAALFAPRRFFPIACANGAGECGQGPRLASRS